jgi:hypothetical protein
MASWNPDLQAALAARVENDIVLARGSAESREFAAMSADAAMELCKSGSAPLFEVVTDGKCYLHFVLPAASFTPDLWEELGRAIVGALPDVPTIKDMSPVASVSSDGVVRVVYRDIVLSAIADNARIARAVLAHMDERPDEFDAARGCLHLDVYELGFCLSLPKLDHGGEATELSEA